jgi:hypothetical protein
MRSMQKNEPITHNTQFQVVAIARQKHQRAYHHKEPSSNRGLLLAASAAATATFILAQGADHSQCNQSSDSEHRKYDEVIYGNVISKDWPKVTALYEEMIAQGVTPTLQVSLWAAAAYIHADQEYKAAPLIESLAKDPATGSARLFWASAYTTIERWQTALALLKEPMPDETLDRVRHCHLCSIYMRTHRLEDVKSAMKERQHLREADVEWLQEDDVWADYTYDSEEVHMNSTLVMHSIYGDVLGSFQILDDILSKGYVVDAMFYEILSISCEVHGRSDLLPLLRVLKANML